VHVDRKNTGKQRLGGGAGRRIPLVAAFLFAGVSDTIVRQPQDLRV